MAKIVQNLVIFSIFFLGLFLFGCVQPKINGNVTAEDAKAFVIDDLKAKYPDAEIREVIQITPSDGSWEVKARVTFNYSSSCPVRIHVFYDYPRKGFVVTTPEYITKNCVVCTEGSACVIGTPEEAIIASHTLNGTESISNYIAVHADAKPEPTLYSEYYDPDTGSKYKDVWIVKWVSETTNYGVFVIISQKGEVLKIWELARSEIV